MFLKNKHWVYPMKNTALILAIAILTAVLIAGCTQDQPIKTQEQQTSGQGQPPVTTGNSGVVKTVDITSSGFSPRQITITAGETIQFVNMDTNPHWPASAMHPTHNAYPEPGGCIGSKFDACHALSPGETFSFTFNQKGTWNYHDHLNPAVFGTVIVN